VIKGESVADSGEPEKTTPSIELHEVRTTQDAVMWLRAQADAHAEAEANSTSPIERTAYRLSSSTVDAIADLLGSVDARSAAGVLSQLAREYRNAHGADMTGQDAAYWRACGHLADTFGVVGAQLSEATRRNRSHRAPVLRPYPEVGREL
jgi:hypothetical protein